MLCLLLIPKSSAFWSKCSLLKDRITRYEIEAFLYLKGTCVYEVKEMSEDRIRHLLLLTCLYRWGQPGSYVILASNILT